MLGQLLRPIADDPSCIEQACRMRAARLRSDRPITLVLGSLDHDGLQHAATWVLWFVEMLSSWIWKGLH